MDSRVIKSASTVAITCAKNSQCGKKIVFELKSQYGCKASVQKLQEEDYIAVSECLIVEISTSEICPPGTQSKPIADLIKICLETPLSVKEKTSP